MFLKAYGELTFGWLDFTSALFVHIEFSFKKYLIVVTYIISLVSNGIMMMIEILDGPWINQSVCLNLTINDGRIFLAVKNFLYKNQSSHVAT